MLKSQTAGTMSWNTTQDLLAKCVCANLRSTLQLQESKFLYETMVNYANEGRISSSVKSRAFTKQRHSCETEDKQRLNLRISDDFYSVCRQMAGQRRATASGKLK